MCWVRSLCGVCHSSATATELRNNAVAWCNFPVEVVRGAIFEQRCPTPRWVAVNLATKKCRVSLSGTSKLDALRTQRFAPLRSSSYGNDRVNVETLEWLRKHCRLTVSLPACDLLLSVFLTT